MKIAADTNVLVLAITGDEERQSRLAQAESVALALPALCGLFSVLSQAYEIPLADIAEVIGRLTNAANVLVKRPAVKPGWLGSTPT
jgi:predicted nucleic-acid-binding protein